MERHSRKVIQRSLYHLTMTCIELMMANFSVGDDENPVDDGYNASDEAVINWNLLHRQLIFRYANCFALLGHEGWRQYGNSI